MTSIINKESTITSVLTGLLQSLTMIFDMFHILSHEARLMD
jgi:hypothetical protein